MFVFACVSEINVITCASCAWVCSFRAPNEALRNTSRRSRSRAGQIQGRSRADPGLQRLRRPDSSLAPQTNKLPRFLSRQSPKPRVIRSRRASPGTGSRASLTRPGSVPSETDPEVSIRPARRDCGVGGTSTGQSLKYMRSHRNIDFHLTHAHRSVYSSQNIQMQIT